jgi:broad specificity phosphatase PhoE
MSIIYLLRHGTRVNQQEDSLLSDMGKKQAELTAEFLKGKGIHEVYVSPLQRTRQTAAIINRKLQLKIMLDDRLKERLLYGDIPNISFEEFLKEWDKTSMDRKYRPLVGDSAVMSGNRIKSLLDDVADNDRKILVVTHGGIIGDFLRNMFPAQLLPLQTSLDGSIQYVQIEECSITVVQKHGADYFLKEVNSTNHLHISDG